MTVIHGKYEWDSDKNEINMRKHGIAFEEILPVFDDPYFYEIYDETHSTASEERYVGVGNVAGMMNCNHSFYGTGAHSNNQCAFGDST